MSFDLITIKNISLGFKTKNSKNVLKNSQKTNSTEGWWWKLVCLHILKCILEVLLTLFLFLHKTIIVGDNSVREQGSIRYCTTRVFSYFVKGRINFRVWCAFMLSLTIFEFEFLQLSSVCCCFSLYFELTVGFFRVQNPVSHSCLPRIY